MFLKYSSLTSLKHFLLNNFTRCFHLQAVLLVKNTLSLYILYIYIIIIIYFIVCYTYLFHVQLT